MNRDGSVAFSLMELMRLEEERVAQERAIVHRKAQDAARARADAEDRRRDEEVRARHAEEARAAAEYARSREEAARIEGMQRAMMERARLDAEEAARGAERAHQLRHAQELEKIRQSSQHGRLRRLIWLMAFATVGAAGGSFAFYTFQLAPQAAREQAQASQRIQKAEEDTRDVERARDEQKRRLDELNLQLAKAAAAAAAIAPAPAATTHAAADHPKTTSGKKNGVGDATGTTGTKKKTTKCKEGDPLCVDI